MVVFCRDCIHVYTSIYIYHLALIIFSSVLSTPSPNRLIMASFGPIPQPSLLTFTLMLYALLSSLDLSVAQLMSAEEELLLQQSMGLNCTTYSKLLNSSNLTLSANSSAKILLANWNCTGTTGAQTCASGLFSSPGSISCNLVCPARYYCPGNGQSIICPPGKPLPPLPFFYRPIL